MKRVLRYISGTRNVGLTFGSVQNTSVTGYSDADWGGCKTTRKSTSGFVYLMAGGAVSWRSRKQTVTATSSCEAEYIATCTASKEAVWLSRLVADMQGLSEPDPITLNVYNQGCIDTIRNQAINQRNKHVDIQYHYVRDVAERDQVRFKYCPTELMTADTLTKPLDRIKFEKHNVSMSLAPLST